MNVSKKVDLKNAILLLVFFVIFTILVKTVNVSPIGPQNTMVGLAGINSFFHKLFPYNEIFYKISKFAGMLICIVQPIFAVMGIIQWVQRKSPFKIDKELWWMLLLYIVLFCTDILFENVLIINYRPILLGNELEASYPSSHTFISIGIGLSAIMIFKKYILDIPKKNIINTIIFILMIAVIITRILSGVHWITDIFGGMILAFSYVLFYKAFAID